MQNIILNVSGYGSIFLGSYKDVVANEIMQFVARQGYECLVEEKEIRLVANPKVNTDVFEIARKSLLSLSDWYEKSPLYPKKCAIGRKGHKNGKDLALLSSSTKKGMVSVVRMLEDISIEEAVANVSVFFPYLVKKMPKSLLVAMGKKKHISQSDINKLTKMQINMLRTSFLNYLVGSKDGSKGQFLKDNTKLAKSKIPSTIGVGEVFEDDPDYSESYIPGSKGIVFLPNSTLVHDSAFTSEESYLKIIQEAEYEGDDAEIRTALNFFKEITSHVLSPFAEKSLRDSTCCPKASAGCMTICNFSSGGRYYSDKDVFGQYIGRDDLGKTYNRLNAGFLHTAFIANPIYFIRVLIEGLKTQAINHDREICEANIEFEQNLDLKTVEQYLPPAIRLNTYSDYPWELICPTLFEIFSESSTLNFEGKKQRHIQFYDYTKIPGRWANEVRSEILNDLRSENEISNEDFEKASAYLGLPSNYHITFSFSGTDASLAESEFALNYANQNATYVFKTITVNSPLYKKLVKDKENMGEEGREVIDGILGFMKALQKKLQSLGARVIRDESTGIVGDMPKVFAGKQVVNGDYYDIRFLDELMKEDPNQGVIVGLSFKQPTNINIPIGAGHEINPLSAIVFKQQQSVASFAFQRLNLGLGIGEGVKNSKDLVRVVITPSELGARNVKQVFKDVGNIDLSTQDASNISFANESGESFGYEDNAQNVQRFIDQIFENIGLDFEVK